MPLQRAAPPAVHFTGFLPSGPFRWGPFTASRDSCPGRTQNFAGFMAKKFCGRCISPGQMEREGLRLPPESPQGNRPQGWRQEGDCCAIRRSFPHTVRCAGERRCTARQGRRPERSLQNQVFTHRTVATAQTAPAGSAETGRCASGCLSESA